ncbi:MAG TPA: CRISPR system precrRNA processing endoribonuclease RAMP protein Cas6 [Thermomicrobiales bacterium]
MTAPLTITTVEVDGTATRPLRFGGSPGEALYAALREAMLKRGCLRDRAHKGECMNCALLPRCAVWPIVAPADPTKRQRGAYTRPFVIRMPEMKAGGLPVGARVTYGVTIVQDQTFPALWEAFALAFVQAAIQLAEWGFGLAVREGEQAARRGAISVGRTRWVNPISGETEPFTTKTASPAPPLAVTYVPYDDIALGMDERAYPLTFLTPTRLVAGGTTMRRPDPAVLLRRIAERLDAVATAVGADAPGLLDDQSFTAAIERLEFRDDATQWVGDEARGGFVGGVTLAGAPEDLARVVAVVRWGAALGVGKGTLHGAGRFVVGSVPATDRIAFVTEAPRQPVATSRSKPAPATSRTRRPDAKPRRGPRKR